MGEGLRQTHNLHCRALLDLGSLPPPRWVSPKNQEIWTLHIDETRYVSSKSDYSLLGDVDSPKTMVIHLTLDMKW